MTKLTPQQFAAKWGKIRLKESTTAQSHFLDVCALVDHPAPLEADPKGEFFTFEAATEKTGGKTGRADVWYKNRFIWEYKGAHADLDKAYQQLLLYRESLGNPPLLITSDTWRIIIHTNFMNTIKQVHEIDFDRLIKGDGLDLLKRAFHDPESFRPEQTQEQVTQATADTFVAVAETLQKWAKSKGQGHDPEKLAHFIIRLLFCIFAEDMDLLPDKIFTQMVKYEHPHVDQFIQGLRNLFRTMRDGGLFGFHSIPHFDGGLFNDDFVPPHLPDDLIEKLYDAARQDWSGIDPSIFGTLFERVIDESKRAQLGAHYTSREDIMLIVEPVLMQPLRTEWQEVKQQVNRLIRKGSILQAQKRLEQFAAKIATIRVLDPACGSGNFLYVALKQLLDLQKEVIVLGGQHHLPEIPLTVDPTQLYGIEINIYAHELAQITIWIGYIQWRFENGFIHFEEPILRPLQNIQRKDAILDYDEAGNPVEPEWPEADVVIGNPPFLGEKKMRSELGDAYINALLQLYSGRLPACDLVCYWFEKARAAIEEEKLQRVGLIATQAIRGGANRRVLERIKETGDIFLAWDDRNWILGGATVHVSIVGFDDNTESTRHLNGTLVAVINSDLTTSTDLTSAKKLSENSGIASMGGIKVGPFDITETQAKQMMRVGGNPNDRPNSDVIRRWANGLDITRRPRNMWIIDFGVDMPKDQAISYVVPFEYVQEHVKPMREGNRMKRRAKYWWIHGDSGAGTREMLEPLDKYIATPRVTKHRMFVFLDSDVLPDGQLIVFARSDDYFLGVLHSKVHELWARGQGTQLREAESGFRYTPTSTFETYPFPWPPGQEPSEAENEHVAAIAEAARELVIFRQAWLHPEDVGITISEKMLKRRTLTNLYNALTDYRAEVKGKQRNPTQWTAQVKGIISLDEIEELDYIHTELDRAVLAAYGWPTHLSDEAILEHLLTLNLERAKTQEA